MEYKQQMFIIVNRVILFIVCILVFYVTLNYSIRRQQTHTVCIKVCTDVCIEECVNTK